MEGARLGDALRVHRVGNGRNPLRYVLVQLLGGDGPVLCLAGDDAVGFAPHAFGGVVSKNGHVGQHGRPLPRVVKLIYVARGDREHMWVIREVVYGPASMARGYHQHPGRRPWQEGVEFLAEDVG